jgi:heme-degrading monooxygenase HmoA
MFRVILRWEVQPGRFEEFAIAWAAATEVIRATRAGALGSELCQIHGEPDVAIAVAHWQSHELWQDSVSILNTHPDVANQMLELAEVTRLEACEVIDSRISAPLT